MTTDKKDKGKNNMEYEIYSRRQQRMQDEIPDTFQYETIPQTLRVQILCIWEKVWGTGERHVNQLAYDAYQSIETEFCEEHGVLSLDRDDDPDKDSYDPMLRTVGLKCFVDDDPDMDSYDHYRTVPTVPEFLLETEDTNKVIDIIEVSFRYIDQVIRDKFYVPNDDGLDEIFGTRHSDIPPDGIPPDEAIDQLNRRFRQHSVGYQYESGQIMKVDSQFIHSEVVKPALSFLSDPIYEGANEEFLGAHKHYRDGRYKECLNDCLKAFESCMKIICEKRGWHHNEKDTANLLIDTIFKHQLIDSSMTCHFTALISTLKSGVPTVRNNQSGHGQGSEPVIVPEYMAAYILHLTASNVLLLAKADEAM